jgi:hypothetical protein
MRGACRGFWHFQGFLALLSFEQGCRFLMVASTSHPGLRNTSTLEMGYVRGHGRSVNKSIAVAGR